MQGSAVVSRPSPRTLTYPGPGDDDRRLLGHDGYGFANFADLKNKKSRPLCGTDVAGHHFRARKLVHYIAGTEDHRRVAIDLYLERSLIADGALDVWTCRTPAYSPAP